MARECSVIEKFAAIPALSAMAILVLAVAVPLFWTVSLFADAGDDLIKGSLDGKPRGWRIQGPRGSANYSSISHAVTQYRIQAYQASSPAMKDSLSLSYTMMNGQLIGSPQVSYLPGKKMFPLYSNEGSGNLVIENEKNLDSQKQLQGRYQGPLVLVEKNGQAPDGKNAMEIDVHFDVFLHEMD